jgi:hypothetical protein
MRLNFTTSGCERKWLHLQRPGPGRPPRGPGLRSDRLAGDDALAKDTILSPGLPEGNGRMKNRLTAAPASPW